MDKNYSSTKRYLWLRGRIDYIVLFSVLILLFFGVIMVFSASYYKLIDSDDPFEYFKKQALFAVLGLIGMGFLARIDWEWFKRVAKIYYILMLLLCCIVLIAGSAAGGAVRWIQIAGFRFQPSEFAKIGVILQVSSYAADHEKEIREILGFIKAAAIIIIMDIPVIAENLSTGLIIIMIGFSIIFVATPKIWPFLAAMILVVILGVVMIKAESFRAGRIEAWLDPQTDSSQAYQIRQSLYAIGSGGIFGLGLGKGRQKMGYLPESHNDIIFSVVCEELGLMGALILVFLFTVLICRGYIIAARAANPFLCYLATGVTTMIAVQVVINMAVATNSMPNTGIPLPFISYGGSSLLTLLASVGILLNVSTFYIDEAERKVQK